MSDISMPTPNVHIMNERSLIIDRLLSELGEEIVIHDEAETIAYECDGLAAYRCPPLAVVLPRSTEEVSRALKLCSELGLPVIPRGSGTSLSGGALPTADSIVIGVSRLNEVLDIDSLD